MIQMAALRLLIGGTPFQQSSCPDKTMPMNSTGLLMVTSFLFEYLSE